MLTGDKQETAINIGFASRQLTQDMELLVINDTTLTVRIISLSLLTSLPLPTSLSLSLPPSLPLSLIFFSSSQAVETRLNDYLGRYNSKALEQEINVIHMSHD